MRGSWEQGDWQEFSSTHEVQINGLTGTYTAPIVNRANNQSTEDTVRAPMPYVTQRLLLDDDYSNGGSDSDSFDAHMAGRRSPPTHEREESPTSWLRRQDEVAGAAATDAAVGAAASAVTTPQVHDAMLKFFPSARQVEEGIGPALPSSSIIQGPFRNQRSTTAHLPVNPYQQNVKCYNCDIAWSNYKVKQLYYSWSYDTYCMFLIRSGRGSSRAGHNFPLQNS